MVRQVALESAEGTVLSTMMMDWRYEVGTFIGTGKVPEVDRCGTYRYY